MKYASKFLLSVGVTSCGQGQDEMKPNDRYHSDATLAAALGLMLFIGVGTFSRAAEPLALRQIMSDLGQDAQAITDGLSREDYDLVANAAQRIANHPRPPLMERGRLLAYLGVEMPRMKGFDDQTHAAANAVAQAARERDGQAVIVAFGRLQTACLSCHQTFRQRIVEHFYGASE